MALTLEEIWQCLQGEGDAATKTRFLEELENADSLTSQVVKIRAQRAKGLLRLGRPEFLAGRFAEEEEALIRGMVEKAGWLASEGDYSAASAIQKMVCERAVSHWGDRSP